MELERPPRFRPRPDVLTVLLIGILIIEVVVAFRMGYRSEEDFNPNMPNCWNEVTDCSQMQVRGSRVTDDGHGCYTSLSPRAIGPPCTVGRREGSRASSADRYCGLESTTGLLSS